MIKITKTKNGKHTKLDIDFKTLEEAIQYFDENILPKEGSKYIFYRYKLSKAFRANVKEYIFLDENDYFMYSYKIAEIYD